MIVITFLFNDAGLVEGKKVKKTINKELDERSARLLLPTGGQTPNPLVIPPPKRSKNKTTNDGRRENFHPIGNSAATAFQASKPHNRNTQRNRTGIRNFTSRSAGFRIYVIAERFDSKINKEKRESK
jgi:hypothetical protein